MREIGRSMVEMLGVLAIIGILSIGGIAGYTLAMNYYKANEIIDDVNKRATLTISRIITQGSQETGQYIIDMDNTNSLGQTVTVEAHKNSFFVSVNNISQGVCQNIAHREWESGVMLVLWINNIFYDKTIDPCIETNTLQFEFANDLRQKIPDAKCSNSPSHPYWSDGLKTCVECLENAHCDNDYFCGTSEPGRYSTNYDTCKPINVIGPETVNDLTYYVSQKGMSWWDANRMCQAFGNKSLIKSRDIMAISADLYPLFQIKEVWSLEAYDAPGRYVVNLKTGKRDSDHSHANVTVHALCQ